MIFLLALLALFCGYGSVRAEKTFVKGVFTKGSGGSITDMAVGQDGSVYIVGYRATDMNLEIHRLTGSGGFLAKMGPSGSWEWARDIKRDILRDDPALNSWPFTVWTSFVPVTLYAANDHILVGGYAEGGGGKTGFYMKLTLDGILDQEQDCFWKSTYSHQNFTSGPCRPLEWPGLQFYVTSYNSQVVDITEDMNGNVCVLGRILGGIQRSDNMSWLYQNWSNEWPFILRVSQENGYALVAHGPIAISDPGMVLNAIATDDAGAIYGVGRHNPTSSAYFTGWWCSTWPAMIVKFGLNGQPVSMAWQSWKRIWGWYNDVTYKNGWLYVIGWWGGYSFWEGEATVVGSQARDDVTIVRFDTNLAANKVAKVTGAGYDNGHSISTDADGNVYVGGWFGPGATKFGTKELSAAKRTLFFGKLDGDLNWQWVQTPEGPSPNILGNPLIRTDSLNDRVIFGGVFSDGDLSFGPSLTRSTLECAPPPDYMGFLTLLDREGNYEMAVSLTVNSAFGEPNEILPFKGTQSCFKGDKVTVAVPEVIYLDKEGKSLESVTEEDIRTRAVTRHVCTGYSVEGSITSGDTNTYTFTLDKDTAITFRWVTEYALEIENDLSGSGGGLTSTAAGNPDPVVTKHWIGKNDPVTAFIDGEMHLAGDFGTRYVVTGYEAEGPPATKQTALSFDGLDDDLDIAGDIDLANRSFTVEFWASRASADRFDPALGQAPTSTALSFDGSDDYVEVPAGIDLATKSFTVEFWAKRAEGASSENAFHAALGQGANQANQGLVIGFRASNVFTFSFTDNDLDTAEPYPDTDWHHWACVYEYDGTQGKGRRLIYRDGSLVAYEAPEDSPSPETPPEPTVPPYQGTGPFYVGKFPSGWSFHGQLDEVRIWDIARTAGEISENRDQTLTGSEAHLVAYWRFDDGPGSSEAADSSAGGRHGTLQNMDADKSWVERFLGTIENDQALVIGFRDNNVFTFSFWNDDLNTQEQWVEPGWHHWACVYDHDSGNRRIYRDGEIVAEDTASGPYQGKGHSYIGKFPGVGNFHGQLDEVRIWNTARTSVEIGENLGTTLTGAENNLVAYWRFEDGAGSSDAEDISTTGGHHGTLENMDPVSSWIASRPLTGPQFIAFESIQPRQQVPPFTMVGPARITYKWKKQYRVQVSTTSSEVGDLPIIEVLRQDGSLKEKITGNGEYWLEAGTRLRLTSEAVSDFFQLKGYVNGQGDIPNLQGSQTSLDITLTQGTTVTWDYGNRIFEETVSIGSPVAFSSVPEDIKAKMVPNKKPSNTTLVDVPPYTSVTDIDLWSDLEKKLYPLRPGKFLLEWDTDDPKHKVTTEITALWPDPPHYVHVAESPPVLLDPSPEDDMAFKEMKYTEGDAQVSVDQKFTASLGQGSRGAKYRSVLLFTKAGVGEVATGDLSKENVAVRVVETRPWTQDLKQGEGTVGTAITSDFHGNDVAHNGYVFWQKARYNPNIYSRQTLEGPIIPVNTQYTADKEDDLVVVWYRVQDDIAWPYQPVQYTCKWPDAPPRIVIASRLGSEGKDSQGNDQEVFDPNRYKNLVVYQQPDPEKPGYNPNEEHALMARSFKNKEDQNRPMAAFALRDDLNITKAEVDADSDLSEKDYTSEPFVLVQYLDAVDQVYRMRVYRVEQTDPTFGYTFQYPMKAGEPVVAPYPLNEVIGAAPPAEIDGKNGNPVQRSYWEDHKGQAWAVSGDTYLFAYFWYPLDPTFWYDRDDDADGKKEGPGEPVPWLPPDPNKPNDPVEVRYDVTWPEDLPVLKEGETLTFSGGENRADNTEAEGLPQVLAWAAGQVVYDSLNPLMDPTGVFGFYSVRLAQVLEERTVELKRENFPEGLEPAGGRVQNIGGRYSFTELHAGLKKRIFYDPLTGKLGILGFVNDKTLGDKELTSAPPSIYVLQPNILTWDECKTIQSLEGANDAFREAALRLYEASRNPKGFEDKDYTVGLDFLEKDDKTRGIPMVGLGPGLAVIPNPLLVGPVVNLPASLFVTLAENNHKDLGALPVALHVIRIDKDNRYRGAIKRILSENVFDEKATLRHTADFGANPDDLVFQWWYREDDGTNRPPPDQATAGTWSLFPEKSPEISLAGAGQALLVDNLFFVRYRHVTSAPSDPNSWSDWAGAANSRPGDFRAQLCEGWVKRVVNAVNPFEARIRDFYASESPATYVSMIQQAGPRYEGPVAFNPQKDVIENVGLIELYQTVLNRARDLSIDLSQPASTPGITAALLLAASRISGFYTLLGNEAYTDALDPTIGIGSDSTEYGSLAPTIFCFMNQVPNLLDEELDLLRGRDEEGARPAYNRLLWNFTKGQGEVAYAISYNIEDVNGDGFINEADGRATYPQGHGDAWGHYLTALKAYYDLLTHPYFNWEARAEKFSIEGVVMDVDYLDERKFAEAAAAKAKVGSELVNLTYRARYVENPEGQWQGYKDTDTDRAWGVSGWGRRACQGALFDWATANALLPAKDENPEHTGLKKIDRTSVHEILEIAGQARHMQKQFDSANTGLNPLGLAVDVVPFDIDPARLNPNASNTATHFEQVYERALNAVENAHVIFDHASDMKNRIRQVAESAEEFKEQVDVQDRDYRNRLIELLGTPYEGVIGTGKLYPAGYKGPDYFLYNYIDVNNISAETVPQPSEELTAYYTATVVTYNWPGSDSVDLKKELKHFFVTDLEGFTGVDGSESLKEKIVHYPMSAADYSFQAPKDWGLRRSPGEIQQALIELVKAEAELYLALDNYGGLLSSIQTAVDLLQAKAALQAEKLQIRSDWMTKTRNFNAVILTLRNVADGMELAADFLDDTMDAIAEALPKVVGLSTDATSAARGATKSGSAVAQNALKIAALAAKAAADGAEAEKEIAEMETEEKVEKAEYKYEIREQLKEIESLLGDEAGLRVEIFRMRENMRQVSEKYRAVLAKALRLMEERKAFNARVAAKTQGNRYQDMAFRVNLNDALSKYRSAFDTAGRYVYLAAKAYDYETNLSDRDPASAQPLLTDVVSQRTLGQFVEGMPVAGRGGLADILGQLKVNYDVLKGQMGFNNPQTETDRFSLRKELFRIRNENDKGWRDELERQRVADLWSVPEFRKFCRPFAPQGAGPQPGLVIPFTTRVVFGKNFFGWPLGGGDHAYDPTNFATKVRSVGLWFENYDNTLLSETPRAYLVPVGMDVMMVPDSNELDCREWTVVDQKLPVPLPVGDSDVKNPDFIPGVDSLDGSMIQIRRYSSFRAYHDQGYFDQTQMSYDSRLIGRSVWNTRWLLIIPGGTFLADSNEGLDTFIHGMKIPGATDGSRDENGVKDIKLFFQTYAISGG